MYDKELRQHENMIVAKLIKHVPEKTWTVIWCNRIRLHGENMYHLLEESWSMMIASQSHFLARGCRKQRGNAASVILEKGSLKYEVLNWSDMSSSFMAQKTRWYHKGEILLPSIYIFQNLFKDYLLPIWYTE